MKTIAIKKNRILCYFITPPENQGQIVTVDYACTEDYILERTSDASDKSETIVAYRWPANGGFDPWNGAPKLGRRAGIAIIV